MSPTPVPTPTPTPAPVETVTLTVTASRSTIVENDWRQPGLGIAHVQFTLINPSAVARYPTCVVQHWELENEGGRTVERTWHGRLPVPAGGERAYGVDLVRAPLDNRQRSDQTGFFAVTCSGTLTRHRSARHSDPAPLPTRVLSSDSTSLSGSRADLSFRIRIRNNLAGVVRPNCHVQVAATAVSRSWYPDNIRVSRYRFRADARLGRGRETTITYRAADVPVHVTQSKYFWVYDAICRSG
jgi:hypothetical protein